VSLTPDRFIRGPQTVTEVAATVTMYAACAPENLLTRLGDEGIGRVWQTRYGGDVVLFDASSAYECCVACIKAPSCGGTAYKALTELDGSGTCKGIQSRSRCERGRAVAYFESEHFLPFDKGVVVSSGNCGHLKQGNRHRDYEVSDPF
jgi:hypothetical protein